MTRQQDVLSVFTDRTASILPRPTTTGLAALAASSDLQHAQLLQLTDFPALEMRGIPTNDHHIVTFHHRNDRLYVESERDFKRCTVTHLIPDNGKSRCCAPSSEQILHNNWNKKFPSMPNIGRGHVARMCLHGIWSPVTSRRSIPPPKKNPLFWSMWTLFHQPDPSSQTTCRLSQPFFHNTC